MRRIIKSEALLQVCPTRGKFPEVEARPPVGMAAHHLRGDVAAGLAQLSQLRGKLSRPLQIGSSPVIQ